MSFVALLRRLGADIDPTRGNTYDLWARRIDAGAEPVVRAAAAALEQPRSRLMSRPLFDGAMALGAAGKASFKQVRADVAATFDRVDAQLAASGG